MRAKALFLGCSGALALLTAACGEGGEEAQAGRGYTIDPATGEHRMTIRREDGEATLRSGATVPVALPEGFSLFPGTRVIETARVTRPGGEGALVTFEADAPAADLAAHYRDAAISAGFAVAVDLDTNGSRLVTAVRERDDAALTLTATGGPPTTGQLFISAPALVAAAPVVQPQPSPSTMSQR